MKMMSFISLAGLQVLASLMAVPAFQVGSFQVHSPAFSRASLKLTSTMVGTIDIDYNAPRDIETMEEWATSCGVQRAEGFQLTVTSEEGEALDVGVMTTEDIPAGSPVLYVPSDMILSGSQAQQELGPIEAAENLFGDVYETDQLLHWYLFLKILTEYERGEESPWYSWLNSLPRYYSNGASMTHFCCSECLPPLVGRLALNERTRFSQFFRALQKVEFLSDETYNDRDLAKWAFSVVYTRCFENTMGNGDVLIVPMADMFNHGATDIEIEISYDEEGNCYAYTTYDVPAGYPLRISYTNGDNTNPSYLFARYGFLEETSPATFCKIMVNYPTEELKDMGYDHSKMLFYTETGEVSEEVWDVLLYQLLESNDPEVQEVQQAFYDAHMNEDYETKQAIHEHYYPQTSAKLLKHVDDFLESLDELSSKAAGRDLNKYPRIPLIMKHNEFVKETFLKVRSQL